MNIRPDHCRALAGHIQDLFSAGFEADQATLHFINSTFDYPDHRTLTLILNDNDNEDREGLIDLIVFPDMSLCRNLESFLENVSFSDQDMQTVFSLMPESLRTCVRVPGLSAAVHFSVPPACRRRFLTQLNLSRPIDGDIRDALAELLPERPGRLAALVRIRHCRSALTGARKNFLLQFIRQSDRLNHEQWFLYLDFILNLQGRPQADQDMFAVLAAEKQNCLKQVEYSRRLTEQLRRSNMETLLLQGTRIGVAADIAALLQRVQIIDEVSLLVWGRMPAAGAPGFCEPDMVSFLFEKDPPR